MLFRKKRAESVLVVDDEPGIQKLLTQLLSRDGYTVTAVGSGAEALAAAQASPPNLVLLDIRMPEMDGFTVFRRLREQGYRGPIVFLSGRNEDTAVGEGLRLGAEYYLTKPFVPRYLLRIAEDAIRGELSREREFLDDTGNEPLPGDAD